MGPVWPSAERACLQITNAEGLKLSVPSMSPLGRRRAFRRSWKNMLRYRTPIVCLRRAVTPIAGRRITAATDAPQQPALNVGDRGACNVPCTDITPPLSEARKIDVTFNHELPAGRCRSPCGTAASVPTAGEPPQIQFQPARARSLAHCAHLWRCIMNQRTAFRRFQFRLNHETAVRAQRVEAGTPCRWTSTVHIWHLIR